MDVKEDVGSPRDRLLQELHSTLCKEAKAEAAEFIPQWDDELRGLLSTEKGGLAAIAIIERELTAACEVRGSNLPNATADVLDELKDSWGVCWCASMTWLKMLETFLEAASVFCDQPEPKDHLEMVGNICGEMYRIVAVQSLRQPEHTWKE